MDFVKPSTVCLGAPTLVRAGRRVGECGAHPVVDGTVGDESRRWEWTSVEVKGMFASKVLVHFFRFFFLRPS